MIKMLQIKLKIKKETANKDAEIPYDSQKMRGENQK